MRKTPNIRIRGIRQVIPSGFILGRISTGAGDVELIPISQAAQATVSSGVVAAAGPAATAVRPHFELYITQGASPSEYYDFPICTTDGLTFPSATITSLATAEVAPTSTVTYYLVNNLATYTASGYPAGVMAKIVFTSGNTTGTITWEAGTFTINRGDVLRIVTGPTSSDSTITGISFLFTGGA